MYKCCLKLKSLVIVMVDIYEHVTIKFKYDKYSQDSKKEDIETVLNFFDKVKSLLLFIVAGQWCG